MKNNPLFDDLLSLGGDMLSHLAEARHDLKSRARSGAETVARNLDLVTRDEFDAAFAMLAKARDMQEDLAQRIAKIESVLNLSSAKKTVNKGKTNLPSVKPRAKRRTRR